MYPLLTKDNILNFCRFARSEGQIYRQFGIVVGSGDNTRTNDRYQQRYHKLKFNLVKKGYLTELDGKLLTVKGEHARRNSPVPVSEAS